MSTSVIDRAGRPEAVFDVGNSGAGAHEAPGKTTVCVRHGRNWRIEADHRRALVRHSVGMYHLAVLIANPEREIPAVELVAGLSELAGDADRPAGFAQPVLDREALRSYRHRVAALSTQIDELEARGESGRAARCRAERDWLDSELARGVGIGGRVRTFPDGAERARSAVTKAIRRALLRIAESDAAIGEHLYQTVYTGVRCCYWPL